MKLRSTLLAATAIALSMAALPQTARALVPEQGLYIAGGAGLNWKDNQNFGFAGAEGNLNNTRGTGQYRNPGFVGVVSMGWAFGNGLRAEVEGNYRNNQINKGSVNFNGGEGRFSGDTFLDVKQQSYGFMVNALFDFYMLNWPVVPYIGAGVGYGNQNFRSGSFGASWSNYSVQNASGNAGGFAYQAIAGLGLPIAAMPGLTLTLEYRYYGIVNSGNNITGQFCYYGECSSSRVHIRNNNDPSNSLLLGARYAFNQAPPPAPAVAPAPVPPARSFLVFFDWDKYNLSDRARAVIKDAAATSKTVQHTRIEVNGYADTSGTPKYNMGLSMRRAQAVAAELVRDGVGKNEIAIKAFGDTVLLVPTGPGVREPQNRRVEIIIR